jgi:ArsR family transcriptional regulator
MRAKGILSCRRCGKNSFYTLKDSRIINVLQCVMHCDETDYVAALAAN